MTSKKSDAPPPRRGGVWVRRANGSRHPFLRGMVTHDLVQRGVSFDDAYAAARAIRDRISDREEIETSELTSLIDEHLERLLSPEKLSALTVLGPASTLPVVVDEAEDERPFSRGLLARSLLAAGLDADRAYRLVTDLQGELLDAGVESLDHAELAGTMGDFLERTAGAAVASRYRTMRRVGQLPRPLVIYVAGATGAGKSTLALELAPLLHIYRVSATDTIRQVIRMVFAPAILPGIHRSSFEADDSRAVSDGDEASVVTSFDEQATRVCVGVRAVVDRALAENMSIIVEGAHLAPPLVPFGDLEGAAYQLMLMLSTLDEEVHRTRFLDRGRGTSRRTEHYLRNLAGIREIQAHLLERSEAHDIPILDTSDSSGVVPRALRLLSGALERQAPWIAKAVETPSASPALFLVIDGLADQPVRSLGGRTPLQAARTPNLDRLAREGICGLADPVGEGIVPDTASGSLAIFGQSPMALKRGPIEVLGTGLDLDEGDIALRGNLATLDDEGRVVDRRAGRIREGAVEIAETLDRLKLKPGDIAGRVSVRVRSTTEHRLAVLLRGEGLSSAIHGSDPGDAAGRVNPLEPQAVDAADERAVATARALAAFEKRARKVLRGLDVNERRGADGQSPANAVLTRGAGRIHRLPDVAPEGRPLDTACISGDRTLLGLARWLGAKGVRDSSMTANLDTDLEAKFSRARQELGKRELVIVHVKGADIAAHDRRPDLKLHFLERVDAALGRLLEDMDGKIRVAVAADHATLSETGRHAADPVPVLISGAGVEADEVERYDEIAVAHGGLQRFPLRLLMSRLFAVSP